MSRVVHKDATYSISVSVVTRAGLVGTGHDVA
jgi:hypothetical protein